jgi:hypothetical protein
MPRTKAKKVELTRKVRPAHRSTGIDLRTLSAEVYAVYERASRTGPSAEKAYEALSEWPGDGDYSSVLAWAQANASLLSAEATCEAGVLRVQLAQLLRDRLDVFQLRAIEDSRAGGVPWSRLAASLAVTSATGAYNKWRRLEVAVRGTDEDRRSPEAAKALRARLSAEAARRRREVENEEQRFPAVQSAARDLLAAYEQGQLEADPEDDFWWDQLSSVIEDRTSPSERANLAFYLRKATEEVVKASALSGRPPGSTETACQAVAAAARLVLLDAALSPNGTPEDRRRVPGTGVNPPSSTSTPAPS